MWFSFSPPNLFLQVIACIFRLIESRFRGTLRGFRWWISKTSIRRRRKARPRHLQHLGHQIQGGSILVRVSLIIPLSMLNCSVPRLIGLTQLKKINSEVWLPFQIHGLAAFLPSNLGHINYKTSLLHLQAKTTASFAHWFWLRGHVGHLVWLVSPTSLQKKNCWRWCSLFLQSRFPSFHIDPWAYHTKTKL